MQPKRHQRRIDPARQEFEELFVEVWNKAECREDVAEFFGMQPDECSYHAGHLRRKGVGLKKFKATPKGGVDYGALAGVAERAAITASIYKESSRD